MCIRMKWTHKQKIEIFRLFLTGAWHLENHAHWKTKSIPCGIQSNSTEPIEMENVSLQCTLRRKYGLLHDYFIDNLNDLITYLLLCCWKVSSISRNLILGEHWRSLPYIFAWMLKPLCGWSVKLDLHFVAKVSLV